MLDDQVWVYVSERPHDFQPLVCCCYCLVPYIRPSLIVLLGFTCFPSPHSSPCSISQGSLWTQSALTEQFTNLELGVVPTPPTFHTPPTQQSPCGWLAKANLRWRRVSERKRLISEFGFVPDVKIVTFACQPPSEHTPLPSPLPRNLTH